MEQHRKTEPGPLNAVMLLAFGLSVAVQWNDPDPLPWMAIYGLATLACVLAYLRRGHWLFPAGVGAAALLWAASIAPAVIGRVPFLDMFGGFEMANEGVERSREMYGLLIVAAWMAVLAMRGAQAPARKPAPAAK